MTDNRNRRETGARTARPVKERRKTGTAAALPRKPRPHGLTKGVEESQEKTRQSEGVNPARGSRYKPSLQQRNNWVPRGSATMSKRPGKLAETEPGAGTPPAEPPSTDRLRSDIDRGITGEKVDYPDPAAAPLGTDDEAAGHPASAAERRMEVSARHVSRPNRARSSRLWLYLFFGIVAVLLVLVAVLSA